MYRISGLCHFCLVTGREQTHTATASEYRDILYCPSASRGFDVQLRYDLVEKVREYQSQRKEMASESKLSLERWTGKENPLL